MFFSECYIVFKLWVENHCGSLALKQPNFFSLCFLYVITQHVFGAVCWLVCMFSVLFGVACVAWMCGFCCVVFVGCVFFSLCVYLALWGGNRVCVFFFSVFLESKNRNVAKMSIRQKKNKKKIKNSKTKTLNHYS